MNVQIHAKLNYLRISPRKVRLVANLIKGMNVNAALLELRHAGKHSAFPMEKLLQSAVANAKNNFQLDEGVLFVRKVTVGEGPTLKRFRARAFGRAAAIRKRSSHISLVLETKEGVSVKRKKKKQGPVVRNVGAGDSKEEVTVPPKIEKERAVEPRKRKPADFVRRMFRRKVI
jgi:large subunit ribosomal protein L22